MSDRANALLLDAFNYFLRADSLYSIGDSQAQSRNIDAQDARDRFDAMYYDGCQETSLNSDVYGAYHDGARDEWCAWSAIDDHDKLTGFAVDADGEPLPL